MIESLLARVEKNPYSTFNRREILQLDSQTMEALSHMGILRRLPIEPEGAEISWCDGRTLTVMTTEEGMEAFDERDPNFEPIAVDMADLACWQFDLLAVAKAVQVSNGLVGEPALIHERIVFAGTRLHAEHEAILIGFFSSPAMASNLVRTLPSSLPKRNTAFVVACPTITVAPIEERALASAKISLARLASDGSWTIAAYGHAPVPGHPPPPRSGRPSGRGLGALLDCWITCHHLEAPFLSPHDFYMAVERYLQLHPEIFTPLPPVKRFSALRSNGKVARATAGGCPWHMHATPPDSPI